MNNTVFLTLFVTITFVGFSLFVKHADDIEDFFKGRMRVKPEPLSPPIRAKCRYILRTVEWRSETEVAKKEAEGTLLKDAQDCLGHLYEYDRAFYDVVQRKSEEHSKWVSDHPKKVY